MNIRQTTVVLLNNELDNSTWITVVYPRTGKHLTMPISETSPESPVVIKAQKMIASYGAGVLQLSTAELKEFREGWKLWKNKEVAACEEAGYGPEDTRIS